MSQVFLVAGLGYGDEGKGTIVEYLTHRNQAGLIVRYNGGPQAAHNVVMSNGRHHVYSQFGSGTHLGAKTFLSRFMLVDPPSLMREAHHLREHCSVEDPLSLIAIDRNALLVTPYHKAANRFRELARGNHRHGSCGMGVGEARADYLRARDSGDTDYIPIVADLDNRVLLAEKLEILAHQKLRVLREFDIRPSPESQRALDLLTLPIDHVVEDMTHMMSRIAVRDGLESWIEKDRAIVFEGAQGVLLDESHGFYPYNTWTNTTFENADTLLKEVGLQTEVQRIGVTRTYMTRHGNGPLVTEYEKLNPRFDKTEHNVTGEWQGNFRLGHLDLVALKYALEVLGGVDCLAMTHMDCLPRLSQLCVSYRTYGLGEDKKKRFFRDDGSLRIFDNPDTKLGWIRDRSEYLMNDEHDEHADIRPNYWPINKALPQVVQDLLGYRIRYLSSGPGLIGKTDLQARSAK